MKLTVPIFLLICLFSAQPSDAGPACVQVADPAGRKVFDPVAAPVPNGVEQGSPRLHRRLKAPEPIRSFGPGREFSRPGVLMRDVDLPNRRLLLLAVSGTPVFDAEHNFSPLILRPRRSLSPAPPFPPLRHLHCVYLI